MLKPELMKELRPAMLEEEIERALDERGDVENCHFYGEALPELQGMCLEFSGCLFERCSFSDCGAERLVFVDCIFETCDLSGMHFPKSTLQRCAFQDCRMTGVQFTNSVLMNVSFWECLMDFANFSEIKAQHVAFAGCALKESIFYTVRWQDLVFQECCMQHSEWSHTLMKGLDMRSSEIDGIVVDILNLKGLRVTRDQALMLSGLLGLKID